MPFHLRVTAVVLVALALAIGWYEVMPGSSYDGPLPPLDAQASRIAVELRADVTELATTIGERNLGRRRGALEAAERFCEAQLASTGLPTRRQTFEVGAATCANVVTEKRGAARPDEIVVVGAHYDSALGAPGADDDATGVAAVLALARELAKTPLARTVRFVAFTNEEAPYVWQPTMGSVVYAKECRAHGDRIVAMLSLETIGYFSDAKGSQKYPAPLDHFYPSEGNFIAFVGNLGSRALVHEATGSFRRHAAFPSRGGAYPESLPGVSWSDHSSFWKEGYRAVMVTDTAPFRYPSYHTAADTTDKVDFERFARVVAGLVDVVVDLAGGRTG